MKVLIVSNDRALLRHLSRFLATFGYETAQVADYQQAAPIADALPADLLLVDSAPDFDAAIELCRAVSQRSGSAGHHILLLLDRRWQSRLLEAVEAGVDDFLARPVVYGEVLMRLRAGARAVEFERRVRRQRRRDPATGLLTCAAFHARLQAADALRAPRGGPLACAAIEIDFFDLLAGQVGKRCADDLLGQFASLLDRVGGTVGAELAHFGNGRFLALLPEATMAEAAGWSELLRSQAAATEFLAGETRIPLTVSVGVSAAEPPTTPAGAIFEKSRQALKTAKASGHDWVAQSSQFAEEEAAWKELATPGRLFERTVARDVMIPWTTVLHSTDSVGLAESLFRQTRLGALAVVDRDEELVGMIFAESVDEYLRASGNPDQTVSKIMTQHVETFDEDTPFADMIRRFAEKDVDLVVVVDNGHPTGVVSAAGLASLSQMPEQPAFCAETPSMRSSYLQIAEPLALQLAGETT